MPIMSITAVLLVIAFAIIGVPIAVALGLGTTITILTFNPSPLSTIPQQIFAGIEIYALIAVPFFIMAGSLMEKLGTARTLVDFSNSFIGWTKGGLGGVNVIASFIFGGVSGSSISDTAALGSLLIPRMEDEGYSTGYSSAITLASSTLAVIVPPSIPMVLWGVVAEVSVGKLFIGGILPGVIFVLLMLAYNFYISSIRGYGTVTKFSFKNILSTAAKGLPALGAPIIIIGSIMTGFVTPSEAGGLAIIYVLIMSYVFFEEFTWTKAKESFLEAMTLSGAILFIVANARLFTWLLIRENVPRFFAGLLEPLINSPTIMLIFISLIFIVVGMFIDLSIAILVFAPLFAPITLMANIDPIHFGVVAVMSLAIGLTTPPFGLCLYSVSLVADQEAVTVAKNTIPFYFVMYAGVLLVILFPQLVLFLTSFI